MTRLEAARLGWKPLGWKGLGGELARFGLVGAGATLVHAALALALHGAGLAPLVSNGAAFLVAFAVSWQGHHAWTFRALDRPGRAATLWRFALVSTIAFLVGQGLMWFLVVQGRQPFAVGLLAVVATVPLATFAGARLWAFARTTPRAGTSDAACAVAIVVAAALWQTAQPPNHDVAWLLTGADRLLDGATFGRDVEDVTPPGAWWLLAPVAALARIVPSSVAVASAVTLLIGVSLLLVRALCRPERRTRLAILAAVLVLPAGYDWAQREHLMLVSVLPYVLLAAQRREGGRVSVPLAAAVGLFAALGVLQKPHFLLVPVALELWLLATTRRHPFRPETLALGFVGLGYVALALVFARPWFTDVLPLMLVAYGAYGSDAGTVLEAVGLTLLLPFAALLLARRLFPRGRDTTVAALAIAGAGATLAALAQGKGWPYHLLPALALLCAAAALAARGKTGRRDLFGTALLVVTLVALAGPTVRQVRSAERTAADTAALARAIAGSAGERRTVTAFNTSPRLVHPAVRVAEARWVGRAGNLHFVPAAVQAGASPEAVRIGRAQGLAVLAALEAAPPDVVLVDERAHKLALPPGHDWLRWFGALAPGRTEALLARYRDRGTVAGLRVLERR